MPGKLIKASAFLLALVALGLTACTMPASGNIQPAETTTVAPSVPETEPVSSITVTEPETTVPETTVPPTEPPHVHEYKSTNTVATCINGGYTEYLCECGDTYTGDETEALGHDWGKWETSVKATWFESGKEARSCTRCGEAESRKTGKKVIANTGTIRVPKKINILDYLIEPKEEDFGKYYDNAVKLYNAFMTQTQEEVGLIFSEETYALDYEAWNEFKDTFEEKCFQNCGVSIVKDYYVTGALPEGPGLMRVDLYIHKTQDLYTAAVDAIHKMGLYDGMSQYDAVYTINQWMIDNIVYELEHPKALDALTTGKAQCAGYADLFEFLCFYVGIDAKYVTGCVGHDDGPCRYGCHAWNSVKLAGTWYYLDICWNDSSNPNRYFLTEKLWSGRVVTNDCDMA